jgi:hypothetical protein
VPGEQKYAELNGEDNVITVLGKSRQKVDNRRGAKSQKHSRAPVSIDLVSAVYRGPKKNWKIKEIHGL